MFGLKGVPGPAYRALARLAYVLPNRFMVGLEAQGRARAGTWLSALLDSCVRRLFQTGSGVLASARSAPPKARTIAVITNAAEPRLDNRFTSDERERSWVPSHSFPRRRTISNSRRGSPTLIGWTASVLPKPFLV